MIKGLRAAAHRVGVSHEIVRIWVAKYGIGRKVGASYVFTERELLPFIESVRLKRLSEETIKKVMEGNND